MNSLVQTRIRTASSLALAVIFILLGAPGQAATWYVHDGTPAGDGTSWAESFSDLQPALDAASSGDEIRLAGGGGNGLIYEPTMEHMYESGGNDDNSSSDFQTFLLVEGVSIRGGFAGAGAADPDFRDVAELKSVLSGGGNSNHVVVADGVGPTTVLDGVTIAEGQYTDATDPKDGQGVYVINDASPVLRHCTIRDNASSGAGAGMFIAGGCRPTIIGCRFEENNAAEQGGAIESQEEGLLIRNSYFYANQCQQGPGGAAKIDDATYVNCEFRGNQSTSNSGGALFGLNLTLVNCLFTGNLADGGSGGAVQLSGSQPTNVINCTFTDNWARGLPGNDETGGGLKGNGSTILYNCVFWNNQATESPAPEDVQIDGIAEVYESCIEGGWTGTGSGNIDMDPLFADQDGPDNQDDLSGADDNNLHLMVGSPCIDTGSNELVPADVWDVDEDGETTDEIVDLDFSERFFMGTVDMGCYDTRDCNLNNIGDLNDIRDASGDVDLSDCNMNLIPDECDIFEGTSRDCNLNGVPDECEILMDGPAPGGPYFCTENCNDCNENGYPDDCDIASGTSEDCNLNGVPDECEIPRDGPAPGGPYFCDGDCNDCNENGYPDDCDIASGTSEDCNTNGIPDECGVVGGFPDGGEFQCGIWARPVECVIADCTPGHPDFPDCIDCNSNGIPDLCDIEDGTAEDCNGNRRLDECDVAPLNDTLDQLVGAGSGAFRQSEVDVDLYQTFISAYGIPWASGTNQTPMVATMVHPASPAEVLRALSSAGCGVFVEIYARVARELNAMEMLLANEAYSDALDPTVGLGGAKGTITPEILDDLYSFEGVPGIGSLLDEELALLRGLPLAGTPSDWLNDGLHFPIYNRLPHHAESGNLSLAYISNYDVVDNADASLKWPNGHGDAYGYYLRAIKVYLDGFRGTPEDPMDPRNLVFAQDLIDMQPSAMEMVDPGAEGGGDEVLIPYEGARNMLEAMAARARTTSRIVDLTFRRDYREDLANQVLEDADRDRAWGTADWARRGAMGVYFDWAIANQLIPASGEDQSDNLGEVHRRSIPEIEELATSVSQIQEQVNGAANGLNPLGLAPNVVSFQLDPNRLDTWLRSSGGNGASHYEQMAEIATSVLDNAQTVFEWANESGQRLREQGQDQTMFAEQVLESEADFNNRLIEFFGYPSPDDPTDNDEDNLLDEDLSEASTGPDLTSYVLTDDEIANLGWSPRLAPGEIQLAISDFFIAGQRFQQTLNAHSNLQAKIQDLTEFIQFRVQKSAEQITIINQAGDELQGLQDRLEELMFQTSEAEEANKWIGYVGDVFNGVASGATISAAGQGGKRSGGSGEEKIVTAALLGLGAAIGIASSVSNEFAAAEQEARDRERFDIAREEIRIETFKEAQLKGIENEVEIEKERLELQALIRESPQLAINIATAKEEVNAALGRLNAVIQRGIRLVAERERIQKLQRDQLQRYRWGDLKFRVFRNNGLQKYEGFFSLAQQYVMLAARAFAYEFPTDRTIAEQLLEDLHRQRRLGSLRGIIFDLNNLFLTAPSFDLNSEVTFSFREDLLGLSSVPTAQGFAFTPDVGTDVCTTIDNSQNPVDNPFVTGDALILEVVGGVGTFLPPPLDANVTYYVNRRDSQTFTLHTNPTGAANGTNPVDITGEGNPFNGSFIWFAAPDSDFRAYLDSRIVGDWQDLPEVREFVDVEGQQGLMGPAIVIPFMSDTRSQRNFFGKFGELFGGDNLGFGEGRNMKVLRYALQFPGVTGGALGNPTNIAVFLIPRGQSLFNGRNASEAPKPWAVHDQNLPRPPLVSTVSAAIEDLSYNPWAEAADSNGHLFSFRPIRASDGRIDGMTIWNTDLAGRSAWNNDWLLVIPGAQFSTGGTARENLLTFIYGPGANPANGLGIDDIELTIEAYSD